MSRRFSDQPINLIHRIPTPEQLSAARPSKRPFGQVVTEAGAACVRGLAEVVARILRFGRSEVPPAGAGSLFGCPEDRLGETSDGAALAPHENAAAAHPLPVQTRGQNGQRSNEPRSAPTPGSVQPEEIAEVRAFLLAQQQDIARLSAQIQELKSLVVSQQQVLLYLGKELETNSLSSMTAGVASAPGKRNRPAREKSGKEKSVARKEAGSPSSLSF